MPICHAVPSWQSMVKDPSAGQHVEITTPEPVNQTVPDSGIEQENSISNVVIFDVFNFKT